MDLKKLTVLAITFLYCIRISGQEPRFRLQTAGKIISVDKFSKYYYSSFDLEKPSDFTLICNIPVTKIEISPKIRQVPFNLPDNKTLHFKLSEPGQFMVRINDSVKIFLFAEKPVKNSGDNLVNLVSEYHVDTSGFTNETIKIQQALNEISGSDKILYFPPGTYKTGQLYPKSNSRIRFARGATLISDTASVKHYFPNDYVENRRLIYINEVENIEITGLGTIDCNGNTLRRKFGDDARVRLILAVKSKNIKIEGLILKNPGSWNTQIIQCNGVILRNLKLLNDIDLSNTDGFDPDASGNVLIENCFAYCGDDNVAVKVTGKKGLSADVDNVIVRGCVFLTKKSALKVGTETRSESMKNITFENNDIIECDRGMALYVNDGAVLDSIAFINNRFERNHPDAQKKGIHFEVDKRNPDSKLGTIKHVLIKDCTFFKAFPNKSVIDYNGEATGIRVTIQNLIIENIKANTLESARIDAKNATVVFN